ncbi:MAG: hypothetical protein ACTSWM_09215, partial [Alphaproteobacteria bacterium]
ANTGSIGGVEVDGSFWGAISAEVDIEWVGIAEDALEGYIQANTGDIGGVTVLGAWLDTYLAAPEGFIDEIWVEGLLTLDVENGGQIIAEDGIGGITATGGIEAIADDNDGPGIWVMDGNLGFIHTLNTQIYIEDDDAPAIYVNGNLTNGIDTNGGDITSGIAFDEEGTVEVGGNMGGLWAGSVVDVNFLIGSDMTDEVLLTGDFQASLIDVIAFEDIIAIAGSMIGTGPGDMATLIASDGATGFEEGVGVGGDMLFGLIEATSGDIGDNASADMVMIGGSVQSSMIITPYDFNSSITVLGDVIGDALVGSLIEAGDDIYGPVQVGGDVAYALIHADEFGNTVSVDGTVQDTGRLVADTDFLDTIAVGGNMAGTIEATAGGFYGAMTIGADLSGTLDTVGSATALDADGVWNDIKIDGSVTEDATISFGGFFVGDGGTLGEGIRARIFEDGATITIAAGDPAWVGASNGITIQATVGDIASDMTIYGDITAIACINPSATISGLIDVTDDVAGSSVVEITSGGERYWIDVANGGAAGRVDYTFTDTTAGLGGGVFGGPATGPGGIGDSMYFSGLLDTAEIIIGGQSAIDLDLVTGAVVANDIASFAIINAYPTYTTIANALLDGVYANLGADGLELQEVSGDVVIDGKVGGPGVVYGGVGGDFIVSGCIDADLSFDDGVAGTVQAACIASPDVTESIEIDFDANADNVGGFGTMLIAGATGGIIGAGDDVTITGEDFGLIGGITFGSTDATNTVDFTAADAMGDITATAGDISSPTTFQAQDNIGDVTVDDGDYYGEIYSVTGAIGDVEIHGDFRPGAILDALLAIGDIDVDEAMLLDTGGYIEGASIGDIVTGWDVSATWEEWEGALLGNTGGITVETGSYIRATGGGIGSIETAAGTTAARPVFGNIEVADANGITAA